MAIDSRDKRFAIMHLGRPGFFSSLPDVGVDAGDRSALLGLYSGIALSGIILIIVDLGAIREAVRSYIRHAVRAAVR